MYTWRSSTSSGKRFVEECLDPGEVWDDILRVAVAQVDHQVDELVRKVGADKIGLLQLPDADNVSDAAIFEVLQLSRDMHTSNVGDVSCAPQVCRRAWPLAEQGRRVGSHRSGALQARFRSTPTVATNCSPSFSSRRQTAREKCQERFPEDQDQGMHCE